MQALSPTRSQTRHLAAQAALLSLAALILAACASGPREPLSNLGAGGTPTSRYLGYRAGKPYQVNGVWYYPREQPNYDEIGIASWYGEQFHNHYTADGEVFDMRLPSAAHTTLPLPSLVEVTNLANGRTVIVRVNDRGPFIPGRVIDLSRAAAEELGFVTAGLTRVRVRYVGQAPDPPDVKTPPAPGQPRQYRAAAPTSAPPPTAPVVQMAENGAVPAAPNPAPSPAAAAPLADVDSLLADPPPGPAEVASLPAAPASAAYELQAGIFSSQAHARRIADGLAGSGAAAVEPFERDGQTLYRVIVRGFSDLSQAAAARRAATALGVGDARVTASGGV